MHFSPACLTVLSLRPVIQFGCVAHTLPDASTDLPQADIPVHTNEHPVLDRREADIRSEDGMGSDAARFFDDTRWRVRVYHDIRYVHR